jgi:uncharacterized membrane protein
LQHGLSLFGDIFWIGALALMAGCSRWAWPQIKSGATIPIHWRRDGSPSMRLGKAPGLWGLVIIAFAVGAYMKVESLSPRLGMDTLLIVFLVRLSAAPLFAIIHLIQVRRGLISLANEGRLND